MAKNEVHQLLDNNLHFQSLTIFSKLTKLSINVLLPSWVNVRSGGTNEENAGSEVRAKLLKKQFNCNVQVTITICSIKNKRSSNNRLWPLISSGMKGMMGGSSLATVSRYARWFLDGSCGNSRTVLRSAVTVLNRSITGRAEDDAAKPSLEQLTVLIFNSHAWTGNATTQWRRRFEVQNELFSTYHQVFEFPVKLLEFAGKLLWKQTTLKVNLQLGKE